MSVGMEWAVDWLGENSPTNKALKNKPDQNPCEAKREKRVKTLRRENKSVFPKVIYMHKYQLTKKKPQSFGVLCLIWHPRGPSVWSMSRTATAGGGNCSACVFKILLRSS